MNKVICDICGTAYPETASQCPICGYARNPDQKTVTDPAEGEAVSGRTHVRGGRFSNANVRKRNRAAEKAAKKAAPPPQPENDGGDGGEEKHSNRGLIAIVILLLIAIVAVSAYMIVRYVVPMFNETVPVTTAPTTVQTQPMPTETPAPTTAAETEDTSVVCTDLKLDSSKIVLEAAGRAWLLDVRPVPENTTDTVTFESSDPLVAQVDANGRITAVNNGQAVITITCGPIQKMCRVYCRFADATTEQPVPSETTEPVETTQPPVEDGILELSREEFSLFFSGDSYKLSARIVFENTDVQNLSNAQIKWTSDDDTVAKVENGLVTAVSPGRAVITAEYNGLKAECIVYCSYEDPDQPTEETRPATGNVEISHEDVTLSVGESFELTLTDEYGNVLDVYWSADESGVCDISGNTITGASSGTVTVSATYNGVTYSCIVRVHG